MLNAHPARAVVAVKELPASRGFYSDVLGLELLEENEEVLRYKTADSQLVVYRSPFAGTNQANAVMWTVGASLDPLVRSLAEKGVSFEHYDRPDMKREGDVHLIGDEKAAWFKDPDGNIHCLLNV